ncbi:GNAT family N-acetyltransferase [Nonomuraea sp. NN258]|uniref:GNAT family N-acetyltransferase n=1 Tax=Nonomuraea antri TaxID=2730852 RepID=UPI001567F086|nr:GNAT family N-acetyltransferase [Nonomuraea antri]NRQ33541.1 GNAT family N-acetyltransferase [Nonomuraea antri]
MLFRPTVEADLDRLLGCVVDEHVSWSHPDRLLSFLESGEYRHERVWIAEENGEIMARAVWWGFADGDQPLALDCLYVHPSVTDRVGLAAELLGHAHAAFGTTPAYHVFLSNGWRDDPVAAAAIAWRQEAVGRAGLTDELERLRYEWTAAESPLPKPPGRLVFRGDDDDETFVHAFARVAQGTLDHHTRQALATMEPLEQAREDVADNRAMPGDRSWWRLAFTQDGDLVGVALPSANSAGPVVGYIGVVPEHRGRGYVDELLAEITRFHAERGVQRIAADTDSGNVPMARAFERAGYRNFAIRLVLSAPTG